MYADLAWDLNKLYNMKMSVIPVVISALKTDPKCLIKGLKSWKSEDEQRPSKLHHYED